MYVLENPVLQRELLVNLRMTRAFVLLLLYVALLGAVVYAAWPAQQRLDLMNRPEEAVRLVNLFFLGQYILMSLMVPSFAGGAITGEKERKTYEMLLASPMRPGAIVFGKLLAALCHLGVLVFASLPIVMLCLPLGGMSFWEALATYVAMGASVVTFGVICLAASSYFTRTIASLVVSYLIILPMALFGVLFYTLFSGEQAAEFRLVMLGIFFPAGCLLVCAILLGTISQRLLRPPDVGSEAKEVVDPDLEQKTAVGMVIRSDQFPDKLFAPPKRTDLMADGLNPVYDKEMRSELFGSGTLMLRLVIQLSMFLALPLMAVCLYMWPPLAPYYTGYVLVFNMLVGPVFAAGTITSERERQTLDLLLCTTVSPWQILWGKLLSSLRVSCVLTSFLVWPLLLAWLLPPFTYWRDTATMIGYVAIIALTSLTTTTLATFCSVFFRRTSAAMMTAYLTIIVLFAMPVAVRAFAALLEPVPRAATATLVHYEPVGRLPVDAELRIRGRLGETVVQVESGQTMQEVAAAVRGRAAVAGITVTDDGSFLFFQTQGTRPEEFVDVDVVRGAFSVRQPYSVWTERFTFASPFAAAFALPVTAGQVGREAPVPSNWPLAAGFLAFYLIVDTVLLGSILWLFNMRWRVTS